MKSAGWTSRQREPVKFFESWATKEGEDKRKRERRKSVGDGGAESERRSRRWSVEDGCAPSRLRVTLCKWPAKIGGKENGRGVDAAAAAAAAAVRTLRVCRNSRRCTTCCL